MEHLRYYLKAFHEDSTPATPLFYAKSHGNIHSLSHDTVETMIKNYCKMCNNQGTSMPDSPHCHMIRKTRAMDLYKSGMPLAHIQQLLGHESMSTISGFYTFATLEMLSKSMAVANHEKTESGKSWNNPEILRKIYTL